MHTYIIGGTGSGKSELMKILIQQYILRDTTGIVVIEPNGDFAEQIAKFKENLSPDRRKKLIYIDPHLDPLHTPIINPFDINGTSEDSIDKATQELASTLQTIFEELGGALTLNMDSILEPCINVMIRHKMTLKDLQRFMDSERNQDLIQLGLQSPNEEVRDFFEHRFSANEFYKTKVSIATRIQRLLNSTAFRNVVLGKNTINLQKELEQQKLIIFNLSKGRIGSRASGAIGRFLVSMIQNMALERAEIPEKQRKPAHLFIDEFHNYISPKISEILEESRKYKLYLTVASQVVGQKMDSDFEKSLLGNSNIKIIGKNDYYSRSKFEKEMENPDMERMKKLNTGKFILGIGKGEAFEVEVSKRLLGHKNSMKPNQWEEIRQEQLKKYYVKKVNPHEKDHNIDNDVPKWKEEDKKNEENNNKKDDFNTPFGL